MDSTVRVVSPFPIEAVPRIWVWMQEFLGRVVDDFSPRTVGEWVADWDRSTDKTWAVYRGDDLGGLITFQRWSPVVGTAHCVFKKSFWGSATTIPATSQALREMFALGLQKLLFYVFADNHAIRALLMRLGARQEGILRKQTMRAGKPVDMLLMGLLREDFDATDSVRSARGSCGRPGQHGGGEDRKVRDDDDRDTAVRNVQDVDAGAAGGDVEPVAAHLADAQRPDARPGAA